MTPERATKLLPIIKAYSEGDKIELYCSTKDIWEEVHYPTFTSKNDYRIKPNPFNTLLELNRELIVLHQFNAKHHTIPILPEMLLRWSKCINKYVEEVQKKGKS